MDTTVYSRTLAVADEHRSVGNTPEFIRLPRSGKPCPWTGLSRSALNDLVLGANPPVRSVCLRKRGAVRGIRLIDYASLIAFLKGIGTQD